MTSASTESTERKPSRFAWLRPPQGGTDGTMSLMDHLRELRYRVTVAASAIIVGAIVSAFFYNQIVAFVLAPWQRASAALEAQQGSKLIIANQGVTQAFTVAVVLCVVAGIFFVYKCAGAAAAAGLDLDEVKRVAEKACANVRTMGVALTSCTVPRVGHPSFEIGDDEMEIGMGIHGEPGISQQRCQLVRGDEIVPMMRSFGNRAESFCEPDHHQARLWSAVRGGQHH